MQELAAVALTTVESGNSLGGQNVQWSIRRGRFDVGVSAGIEVVVLQQANFSIAVLPTRGMGILSAQLGDLRIGWDSPVRRPVHPSLVNLQSRNGLGWLDGFNELMCRCGLSYNGPPGQDEAVGSPIESDVTLHGKIANLPAHDVRFIIDHGDEIGVRGTVDESTLFGPQLRLESTIVTKAGQNSIIVRDRITNLGSGPTELQLLYHTNFGSPLLEENGKVSLPAIKVVPRDARAVEDLETWQTYRGPTNGYTEQGYFFEPIGDEQNRSISLLESADGKRGVSLAFCTDQLPCFTLWKCTQPTQDGYVTGLEPGTGYPNFKSFERRHGRVVKLESGAVYETELTLTVLNSAGEVEAVKQRIQSIQGDTPCDVYSQPTAPYCSAD